MLGAGPGVTTSKTGTRLGRVRHLTLWVLRVKPPSILGPSCLAPLLLSRPYEAFLQIRSDASPCSSQIPLKDTVIKRRAYCSKDSAS